MTTHDDLESWASEERRARELLTQSLAHIDAHARSRLTHARHEASAVAARPRSQLTWLRSFALMPAAGAAAAALAVAAFLWVQHPEAPGFGADTSVTAFEDVSLLTDSDGLDMVEDADASFYEWAAGQT